MDDEGRALVAEHEDLNAIILLSLSIASLLKEVLPVMVAYLIQPLQVLIEIAPGKKLRVAQTQDDVVYPDGSTAKIITGAGQMDILPMDAVLHW
jgi:hypothetical protein